MATNNHIHIYTSGDIEKYHKGLLSQKERHALEKAALDDPFLADALEGYAVAGNEISADMAELRSRLDQRMEGAKVVSLADPGKRAALPWLRIAAIFVILVGAGLLANQFLFTKKTGEIAQKNSTVPVTNNATDTSVSMEEVTSTTPVAGNTDTPITTKGQGADKKLAAPIVSDADKSADLVSNAEKKNEVTRTEPQPTFINPSRDIDNVKDVAANSDKRNDAKSKTAPVPQNESVNNRALTKTQPLARNKYESNKEVTARSANNDYNRANSFRGKVTDNNNRGLPFANVTNVQDNVGTYTDASGNFILTSPDSILDVQVRSVGFENAQVQLRNDVIANQVVMQDDRKNLSEVVVSTQKVNSARRQQDNNLKLEEPEPADGWENYDVYLTNNLNIPPEYKSRESGKQEVELSFEVNKNGAPTNIRVERSLCKACDDEAIRLIKEGPKWKRKAKKGRTKVMVSF